MAEELEIEEKAAPAEEEEGSSGASFTVGFTALSILLLAFFILLSSMSSYDKKRSEEALGSVLGAFGIMPSGVGPLGGERLRGKEAPLLEESFQRSWRNFRDYIRKRRLEHLVEVSGSRKVFRISLAERLLFDSGEAKLRPSSLELLETVRYLIADSRNRVRIEGHTDDLPPDSSRYSSNWELSAARAVSVLRYLLRDSRIDSA
ncbi:MAG: flagellar motor protein MotB, partial [Nitrospinota bacterium]